ncbi:MAG: ribbon-helix-helix protein, CopG family [Candidatus Rokubacteria bacterium]|nr:ribbon-helix-helix protein, CopG family [Candidatus Rokubacteria bacterium]
MHRRVNITLPEETIRLIDRAAARGDRSRFIDQAVRHLVHEMRRAKLKTLLKEGAVRRAERDLLLAEEWFSLDEEAWQRNRK